MDVRTSPSRRRYRSDAFQGSTGMSEQTGSDIAATLQRIPSGLFILTAAHGGTRSGILTKWVQPCSADPPHVMVAIARGTPIEPLIRDSRTFALCQISEGDRLLQRCFAELHDRAEDPFISLPSHDAPSGSPVIDRALCYLDCELVRHVVLDADYRVYVGQIHHGGVLDAESRPAISVDGHVSGTNGLNGHNGTPPPKRR